MKLEFINPKHEALVNDYGALSRKFDRHGKKGAEGILAALAVLHAADCLADVPRAFRPHPLKAGRKGQFAIDVTAKERVIFKPKHDGDPNYRIDNYKTINSITILEIFEDYH